MSVYAEIGRQIRQRRQAHGWTQAALGARLTPPRGHASVSYIESGQTRLDLDELQALAAVLDCTVQELCGVPVPLSPPPDDGPGWYALSFLAYRARDRQVETSHAAGYMRANSKAEAIESGLLQLRATHPLADGWAGHDVAVLRVSDMGEV